MLCRYPFYPVTENLIPGGYIISFNIIKMSKGVYATPWNLVMVYMCKFQVSTNTVIEGCVAIWSETYTRPGILINIVLETRYPQDTRYTYMVDNMVVAGISMVPVHTVALNPRNIMEPSGGSY